MERNRLEAFSDGVFAIVITLLVLDLRVPEHESGRLWSALTHEWPQFVAFIVSFAIVGIIWLNHHSLVRNLKYVDRPFLMLNLFLLLTVALIPFPTALVADVIRDSSRDASVAASIYAGSLELMAIAIGAMWLRATMNGRLLESPMPDAVWRKAALRFSAGHIPYLAAIGLAFVDAWLSLGITFVMAVYYAFEQILTPEG